jgi:acyl-CoA thioesterase-1
MKQIALIFIAFIGSLFTGSYAQDYHVRIGTIGNSITEGTGLPSPSTQSYPAQLQIILNEVYGDTCIVRNFGLTSTTMLKNGDVPYWNAPNFQDVMDYAPEICLISLGTNDSKPQNWDVHSGQFHSDYLAMIDTLSGRNPSMKFMLCLPPPAFQEAWGIRDTVIVNYIIPIIDSIVDERGTEVIDFHSAMLDSSALFPDGIHPNQTGAHSMAQYIVDQMIGTDIIHEADTGQTFVTSFKTNTLNLEQHDSATLTWISINADSVFLNGQMVDATGNIKVSPSHTMEYTLVAMGQRNNDSLTLSQNVYIPTLSRLAINPGNISTFEGDTLNFINKYFDQVGSLITDTTYEVQWSIASGSGHLIEETDISVKFVAEGVDTTELMVEFGDISAIARIIVKALVAIDENTIQEKSFDIFPNPGSDMLNLGLDIKVLSEVSISIYDLKGILIHQEFFNPTVAGKQEFSIDTRKFPEGSYFVNANINGTKQSSIFIITRN